MRVKGQSILVTGAGNGIGEGIAKRMAEEGAVVTVNDIDPQRAYRVCQDKLGLVQETSPAVLIGRAWWTLPSPTAKA